MAFSTKRFGMSLFIICFAHLLLDYMLGIWAVYKTIADLDLMTAGLMASVCGFIGEGSQIYFGTLSDRGNSQKLMELGIGLTVTIPFLMYVHASWMLFIFLLSVYIGSGAFHPSASSLIISQTPVRKSLFIALFACAGMLGAGMSQYTFVQIYYLSDGHTWVLALPVLAVVILCLFYKMPQQPVTQEKKSLLKLWQELKPWRWELGLLYIIAVCLQIVVLSFSFLLPEILQAKGFAEWFNLGGGYFYFILGAALTSIPLGCCIDKWSYRPILVAIIVISALSLHAFLSIESLSFFSAILLLLVIGGSMGVIVPVMVAGANSLVPTHMSGFVSGVFMGGAACLAGFGPILASALTSYLTEAPTVTLQLMNGLLVLALGVMYFLPNNATSYAGEFELISEFK